VIAFGEMGDESSDYHLVIDPGTGIDLDLLLKLRLVVACAHAPAVFR
jgi:hypothetical protein